MYRTLSDATTPGQSGPGSDSNEGVLHIPQGSITGTSWWDCFVPYAGHSLAVSYPSADSIGVFCSASRVDKKFRLSCKDLDKQA